MIFSRRSMLWGAAAVGAAAIWPDARLMAQQAYEFIEGAPVPGGAGLGRLASNWTNGASHDSQGQQQAGGGHI